MCIHAEKYQPAVKEANYKKDESSDFCLFQQLLLVISLGAIPDGTVATDLASLLTPFGINCFISCSRHCGTKRRPFSQAGRSQHHLLLTSCLKQLHIVFIHLVKKLPMPIPGQLLSGWQKNHQW